MPPQQYPQPFSPQTHAPFSTPPGMPPNYPTMSPGALGRPPVRNPAYKAPSPSNQSGESSRQNSLPSASSALPARPSFDPPNFNRQDMQRLHNGLVPPPSGNSNVSASSSEVPTGAQKAASAISNDATPTVTTQPAAEGKKKKKSKSSSSNLVFSNNEQSPEELMATLNKYTFERNSGVEWSQGEVGGAVTGRTVDEDTVLDPQN